MREEVEDRLRMLIKQRAVEGWKDGWIYGQLKQEFKLSIDELNLIVSILGFKCGWNALVEDTLEKQWQEEKKAWKKEQQIREQENQARRNVVATRKMLVLQEELKAAGATITDVEELLITMILRMSATEQARLLEKLCKEPLSEIF